MSQPFARRAVPAAILAASLVLVLALPARAAGPGAWTDPPGLFARALQWLAALWPGEEVPDPVRDKAGLGVDPNGTPAPPPPPTDLAACSEGCEGTPG